MATTIYVKKDNDHSGYSGFNAKLFDVRPGVGAASANEYAALSKKISLKKDFGWREVQNLQELFCRAEIWNNFPAEGLKFITAETRGGDEDQRVDVLYLRDDGGLYPCELKLGGDSLETHGQIIRYIADLSYQNVSRQWIVDQRRAYFKRRGIDVSQEQLDDLSRYFENQKIDDRHIRLIRNAGIIVDEFFKPQMLKAVRYLNEHCGFSIRLLRLDTYVSEDWQAGRDFYLARIDIVEVQ